MKIKYIHFSDPETEKIYDTEVSLARNPSIHKTQEEFDQFELGNMERDKNKGYILSYEVIG